MSSASVFAEYQTNPEVAAALREHRADRDALLSSRTESLEADPRVRAAWLWGSFGRGEADDLSDLDPWLIVTDEAAGEIGASLLEFQQTTGSFLTGALSPQFAPPGGGYFSSLNAGRHGLLQMDCYWQPQSAEFEVPEQAVLFNRLNAPYTESPILVARAEPLAADLTPEQERIDNGIGFAWFMLSITAKKLARDPQSDMALLAYPRPGLEDSAELLGLPEYLQESDWIVPDTSLGKVVCLRGLNEKTAHLTEAAREQGMDLSPQSTGCLSRYLDLAEGILQ